MRTIFIVALSVFTMTLAAQESSEQAFEKAKKEITETFGKDSIKVLRIRNITLNQGVEPLEFERFVTEEFNPFMNGLFPCIQISIMKGDRDTNFREPTLALVQSLQPGNYTLLAE